VHGSCALALCPGGQRARGSAAMLTPAAAAAGVLLYLTQGGLPVPCIALQQLSIVASFHCSVYFVMHCAAGLHGRSSGLPAIIIRSS
jgi:hypothetical protein